MMKILAYLLFFCLPFLVKAQNSASDAIAPNTYIKPKAVKLNRSLDALGISQKVNDDIKNSINPPLNLALFAVDRREKQDRENSDVIIIVSIDQQSGKIKMSSIMRDTYVNIEGHGMDKINAAYALGGPQLAIKTINQNFDLDIKDYINVDFYSAAKIVDALGGVIVNVKEEELPFLNNYLDELAIYEKIKAIHLPKSGLQQLDGRQAVAYTRIRAIGNGDYERTERQRNVLLALFNKLKNADSQTLPEVALKVLPNLETSMDQMTLFSFAGSVLNKKNKDIGQARFPLDNQSAGKRINNIWYLTIDLKATTAAIHKFIYE